MTSPTSPKPDLSRLESRLSTGSESNGTPAGSQNFETNEAKSKSSSSELKSEIVYDSATLRLSVKDKIKRLKQSQIASETSEETPLSSLHSSKKASSLPKCAQLPETAEEGSLSSPKNVKLTDAGGCFLFTSF